MIRAIRFDNFLKSCQKYAEKPVLSSVSEDLEATLVTMG